MAAPESNDATATSPSLANAAQDGQAERCGETLRDDVIPDSGVNPLPIVGLGGSAGGIRALQKFFAAMPVDSGMAFVIIMHLSPEHESILAETLQRCTAMRVVMAVDGAAVEPNCVYVIPPGKHLASANGRLALSDLPDRHRRPGAVDFFFRSLADTHGSQSVAVVLSGADGDGALGIKRVKERGGLTIAQDPDEAEHEGMPRAAIATGMVDWVLSVTEMPARLAAFAARRDGLKLPVEDGPHPAQPVAPPPDADEAALRDVLAFLRTRTGRDFSYYKRATILRRIARRMQVNGNDDLPGYLAYLGTHAGEAGALLQDLLISVTNFFRDHEAFEALEAVVPELFRDKGPQDMVRVWVPACATGEEAYSVAMLLCEHARKLEAPPQIQVFATDLDDEVIRQARDGIYPETIGVDVSEERLRRFFLKEHQGFRVRREVREVVLFALHDLLKDSPFSRLDLISCRNLLIYLNRDAQRRALDIFHFALRPGGRLFLGSSESMDEGSSSFAMTDKKHRLYVRRPGPRQMLPVPSGPSTLARALDLQERARERPTVPARVTVEGVEMGPAAEPAFAGGLPWSELHYKLIERVSPPSVLVNAAHEIVHLSESAGRFLQFAGGEPTRNLLRAVHPMLRIELRAALYAAAQTHAPATAFRVPVEIGEKRSLVDLRVTPANDLAPDCLLVVFDTQPGPETAPANVIRSAEADLVSQQLERELETTKAQLRDTIEQSDASTEELKASNEELQAMNEELRSATEELETSREELQSINEELTTVNQELKSKVDQLAHANSDLQNLMSATAIATVFLDRELRIVRYTPSAVSLFNFIPTDVGRPLTDLAHRLDYPEFVADAERSLEHLASAEREVRSAGRWFLARALPYRTNDDRIAGVVFTFLDITERKKAEDALRESEQRFRTIVSQASAGVAHADLTGRLTLVNPRLCEITGYPEAEVLGRRMQEFTHPDDREELDAALARLASDGSGFELEKRHLRKDGSEIWAKCAVSAIRDAAGAPQSAVIIVVDVTDWHRAEDALRARTEEVATLLDVLPACVWTAHDPECRVITGNRTANELFGTAAQANHSQTAVASGEGVYLRLLKPDGTEYREDELPIQRAIAIRQPVRGTLIDFRLPDGRSVKMLGDALPLFDENGNPRGGIGAFTDVTALKQAEEEVRASEERFRAMANAITQLAWIARPDGHFVWYNQRWYDYTGTTPEEMEGWGWQAVHDPAELPKVLERWKASIATGEPFGMTFPLRGADGTFRQFLTRGIPLKNADGEVVQWFGTNTDVDEITRAERALRESNQTMFLATEATGVGIWEWNVLTNEIGWDAQLFRIYGIAPTPDGVVCYQTWSDAVLPEDLPEQEKILQETIRTLGRSRRKFRIRRAGDGEVRHIEAVETVRANEHGQAEWVVGTNLDVTEREEAQAALTRSERFNVAVLDSLPAEIAVLDRDGRIIAINEPWLSFAKGSAGSSPERVGVGVDYLGVCRTAAASGDDLAQKTIDGLMSVLEGRAREFRMEYPCHAPDRRRWFELHVVRPAEEVGGAIVAHTDITERRRAEELLMEQDNLLESFAIGAPLDDCLAAICDAICRLNRARAGIFVASADGKNFSHSVAPGLTDFAAEIARAPMEETGAGVCAAAALRGEAVSCADIAADHRWSPAWTELSLSHDIHACHSAPVLDADGRAMAVLTLYFDAAREPSEWELGLCDFGTHLAGIVLERERTDAALREARDAAEAANQAKDRFLAVLSHELRTPLTPVLMTVGDLAHDPDLPPEVREEMAMIKRNVELETKLIDDLLDLNRISSGKVELRREPLDLKAAVRDVCDICRPQMNDKKVRLETDFAADTGLIAADPARIRQVLWNVLRNAVKFTPAQGTIRVSTARLGPDCCEVRVRDSGMGIPPEVLPRIFKAFEQGDAQITREFGGLGLGLAISRALVELHGGSIRAESAGQGQGATFIIELPGQPAAPAAAAAPVAAAAERPPATQLRLLLVEDHADTARTLSRLLAAAGFTVVTAANVAGAIATAGREPFDVIVSDLGLPDGSGCEIIRAIQAKRPVPGIAMSGYGMNEDIRRSREAGFAEHLVKPIEIPQLIAAIHRVAADPAGTS